MLTQTTASQHRCKILQHKLPIPDAHFLFNMPLDLRLGPLKFLIIPRHQPFISIASKNLHNYSTKSLAQRRISTTSQAVCKNKNHYQHRIILLSFFFSKTSQKNFSLVVFQPPPKKTAALHPDLPAALFQLLCQASYAPLLSSLPKS